MQKIYILEYYKGYKKDRVYAVNENEAHTLIDSGVAELYHDQDKMMRPTKKRMRIK